MIPTLRPGEPLPPDADFGYVVAARGGHFLKRRGPEGVRPAGSIHSHPGFAAKFSMTDERDERVFDGLHVVASDKGFSRPAVACAAVVSGRRIELDPEDVIEGYDADAQFPEEWLDRVTERGVSASPPSATSPAVASTKVHPTCAYCEGQGECPYHQPDPDFFCPMLFEEREEDPCSGP
jgi:hypothetical protein